MLRFRAVAMMGPMIYFIIFLNVERIQMGTYINQEEYYEIKSVIQAVMDSYDVEKSFHENFFTLLHLMCPYSVQCDFENTGPKFSYLENRLNDTLYLSDELFQNRNTSSMNEARMYLEASFINRRGCCKKCSCTDHCRENNCCPLNKAKGTVTSKRNVTKRQQQCVIPVLNADIPETAVYMITDCLNTSGDGEVLRKCKYPNTAFEDEIVPVYSNITAMIYKNKYCAFCNNDFRVISWQMRVLFSRTIKLIETLDLFNSSESIYQIANRTSFINIMMDIPDELSEKKEEYQCYIPKSPRYTLCYGSKFMTKEQKYFFNYACSYYESKYFSYRNIFCYLCAIRKFNEDIRVCQADYSKFSFTRFTALMVTRDPPSAGDVSAIALHNSPCTCEEYYDDETRTCRKVICPPANVYSHCSCEPFLERITGLTTRISLEVVPKTSGSLAGLNSIRPETIVNQIHSDINKYFRKQWGPMKMIHIAMYRETSLLDRTHVKLHVLLLITSKLDTDNILLFKTIYQLLNSGTELMILKTPMILYLGRMAEIPSKSTSYEFDYTSADEKNLSFSEMYVTTTETMAFVEYKNSFQSLKKLWFCKRIALNDEEMSRLHNYTLYAGYSFDWLPYIVDLSTQQICFDDFIYIFVKPNSTAIRLLSYHNRLLIAILQIHFFLRL